MDLILMPLLGLAAFAALLLITIVYVLVFGHDEGSYDRTRVVRGIPALILVIPMGWFLLTCLGMGVKELLFS